MLYRVEQTPDGVKRIPVFSDADMDVIKAHKVDAVRDAHAAGKSRPEMGITSRTCTYPVDAQGRPQADGSTCDELDL